MNNPPPKCRNSPKNNTSGFYGLYQMGSTKAFYITDGFQLNIMLPITDKSFEVEEGMSDVMSELFS
ncbi:MAG TPA: hypothetical protein VE130_05135 [Nitrososphaeraceae archaeon]|jgi:hypothetical protein|nr:hypothetical protein [Nitrososphaeraceae archaeon]